MSKAARIAKATLVFDIATDSDGNVICLLATSGHPPIIGAAIDSIRNWKFRPTRIRGQRQPIIGTPVLAILSTRHGLKTTLLSSLP